MIRFCVAEENHRLYSAMQISCPCFQDKKTLFTKQEVDTLRKTLLSASRDQAGAFLMMVAASSEDQHKQLMVQLGKDHTLYEHVMGDL